MILICWIADAGSVSEFTSTPLTTSITPLVPIADESRKRDIVAMTSLSKIGRFRSACSSTVDESRLDVASARTSAAALPTVISCVIPARGIVIRTADGGRLPTVKWMVVI